MSDIRWQRSVGLNAKWEPRRVWVRFSSAALTDHAHLVWTRRKVVGCGSLKPACRQAGSRAIHEWTRMDTNGHEPKRSGAFLPIGWLDKVNRLAGSLD
jgi:hypothetical protein